MENYQSLLDLNLEEGNLTPFQHSFLGDIKYFTETKGNYQFNKNAVINLYSETMTPEQITKEINDLIERKWISKESKKVIFEGRYFTKTILILL